MLKALCISALIIALFVIAGDIYIRKKWDVQYKKGSRYYVHRTTLHFWAEGLLLLGFLALFYSKNEILFSGLNILFAIPLFILMTTGLRTFVEWKVAYADNAWRCELLVATGNAVFLGVAAIIYYIW